MSGTDFACESLLNARRHIEAGPPEALKLRVRQAIVRYLIELNPENFPDGLWGEFAAFIDRVSRAEPTEDAGSVARSLEEMSDKDIKDVVAKISELHEKMAALAKR